MDRTLVPIKTIETQVISSIFLVALLLPTLDMVFRLDSTRLSARAVSFDAEPTLKGMLNLPGIVKWYFENNFGFRAALLQAHGNLKTRVLRISSSPKVLIGREGWLFLASEGAIDSYRNLYPFPEPELQRWLQVLDNRATFCRERDITYVFTVAPDKTSIYPDMVPPNYDPVSSNSRLDAISQAISKARLPVNFVDFRPMLKAATKTHRTYHKTDTHWNSLGAFFAAQQLKATSFGGATSLDIASLTVECRVTEAGDLARLLGLKYVLQEEQLSPMLPPTAVTLEDGRSLEFDFMDVQNTGRVITHCTEAPFGSAVVFHDSFGVALIPFIAENFRRCVFVWSDDFQPEVVESEQPDYVIQEIVERRLGNWSPKETEIPAAGSQL